MKVFRRGALGLLLALVGPAACGNTGEEKVLSIAQADEEEHGEHGGHVDYFKEVNKEIASPTATWSKADEILKAPIWRGNDAKGLVYAPLFRGAFPGLEEWSYTPRSGDCTKSAHGTVRMEWDQAANTVKTVIKGVHFDQHPGVQRTEGVNWWANPWHPADKDITDGAYRLWIIIGSPARLGRLWYSASTLQLVATEFSAPSQPPNTIEIKLPAFRILGTKQFVPDANDNVHHEFTSAYDVFTSEGGLYSFAWVQFAPEDLCQAAPLQPHISQLRPIQVPWQPGSAGVPWTTFLRGNLAFDLHLERTTDPTVNDGYLPEVWGNVSVTSTDAAYRGGIPNGWHQTIMSAIQSVSPVLDPVQGGGNVNGCVGYVNEPHVTAPLYCQGQH